MRVCPDTSLAFFPSTTSPLCSQHTLRRASTFSGLVDFAMKIFPPAEWSRLGTRAPVAAIADAPPPPCAGKHCTEALNTNV